MRTNEEILEREKARPSVANQLSVQILASLNEQLLPQTHQLPEKQTNQFDDFNDFWLDNSKSHEIIDISDTDHNQKF